MQLKRKPYNLLLWTGFLLVLTSFFVLKQNNALDIHLHDTYFVITHIHIIWFLAGFALLSWVLYLLTNKLLYTKALIWIHVLITISSLLLLAWELFFGNNFMNPAPRRYYDFSSWNSFDSYHSKAIGISIFVLLSGQIIFVINLIAGQFKKQKNRNF